MNEADDDDDDDGSECGDNDGGDVCVDDGDGDDDCKSSAPVMHLSFQTESTAQ